MRARPLLLLLPLLLFASACAEEVVGPAPSVPEVDEAASTLPLVPALVCRDQLTTEVALAGEGFSPLPVDVPGGPRVALPTVRLDREASLTGGEAVPETVAFDGEGGSNGDHLAWESQTRMTLTVDQAMDVPAGDGRLSPGLWGVSVTNPNGHETGRLGALAVAPRPEADAVTPGVTCLSEGSRAVTVSGRTFLRVGPRYPALEAGEHRVDAVTIERCAPVAHAGLDAETCESARFTLAQDALPPGRHALVVDNPEPAACVTEEALYLTVVPPPSLDRVVPALVCTADGRREVVVEGTGLLEVDGTLPAVTLGGDAVEVTEIDACEPLEVDGLAVRTCGRLTVSLPQAAVTEVTVPELVVTNPEPAGCRGTARTLLALAPPPTISGTEPVPVCAGTARGTVVVRGAHFLVVDGAAPAVTLDGAAVAASDVAPIDCTAQEVPEHEVVSCTGLAVTFALAEVDPAAVDVTVTNPDPAGCAAGAAALAFELVDATPTVDAVAPEAFCTATGGALTVSGGNFLPGATVRLSGPGGTREASAVTVVDGTELQATFDGGLAPGVYDLTVSNGGGCEATLARAVEVDPVPFVFFIDPPVAYDQLSIRATIYTAGLTAEAARVELLSPSGSDDRELAGSPVKGEVNRIQVTLPQSLEPGLWDVAVTSRTGCTGTLTDGLNVTDDLTVNLASVSPAYVSKARDTAVTVLGATPVDQGGDFIPTPRAYLNPSNPGPDTVASALQAVDLADPRTLTAVVPAGLADAEPMVYDLIVVNPDASVGLLSGAVTVTVDEPPRIDSVVPGSLDANAPQVATLHGAFFDDVAPTVEMTCRDPLTGVEASLPAQVVSATPTEITATFPSDQFVTGSVCLVTLTNGDGASFSYSAVSVRSPSGNLYGWNDLFAYRGAGYAPPSMVEARRALALAAGRPTDSSRFLYAVGGDPGAPAGATGPGRVAPVLGRSVEAANVGVFGDLAPWRLLESELPAARTQSGLARIGRFLYLLGGHDGTSAVDTVLRAEILDPLAAPEIVDLGLALGEPHGGFGAGFWTYRVAAVFGPNDPVNPGGESLPGEPLVVQLPDQEGIELTVSWSPVPDAVGYRLYRTPAVECPVEPADPGAGTRPCTSSDVELLAEVDGAGRTSWVDAGGRTDPAVHPLVPGALGVWHDAGLSLATPREGLAVVAAASPDPTQPDTWYLYAFGGRDAAGTWLDTWEVFTVDVSDPARGTRGRQRQSLTGHALGTTRLSAPRADLGAWRITRTDVGTLGADETVLFVGPGSTTGGSESSKLDAAFVGAGGDLGPFTSSDARRVVGAGHLDGNGYLFLFGGGAAGSASSGGVSAPICQSPGVPSGCSAGPPELRNWTAEGTSMSEPRAFMGAAQESAFYFVAGGCTASCGTAAATVTDSVDQTVK